LLLSLWLSPRPTNTGSIGGGGATLWLQTTNVKLIAHGYYPLTIRNDSAYALGQTRGKWATRYTWPNQIPFRVWERAMPRISDLFADVAVYIYRDLDDAKLGESQGGSGFVALVSLEQSPDWCQLYV